MGEKADLPLSVEYPDSVDSADSDVADSIEPDVPERADPGLEKRRGPYPLCPSSQHDDPDSGLPFVPGA